MRTFFIIFLIFASIFAGYISGLWCFAAKKAAADNAKATYEQVNK